MKTIEHTGPAASEQAIREGQSQDVVVLQDGKPVALVVPFDGDDLRWYATEHDATFIESIAQARDDVRAGRSVSHEELKKELGL
ncbi:MAG: hypothetical protein JWN24_976 [Phycisphaerales bacterium]|nr:hypothetical protein [Phycisphaerales bacterium]